MSSSKWQVSVCAMARHNLRSKKDKLKSVVNVHLKKHLFMFMLPSRNLSLSSGNFLSISVMAYTIKQNIWIGKGWPKQRIMKSVLIKWPKWQSYRTALDNGVGLGLWELSYCTLQTIIYGLVQIGEYSQFGFVYLLDLD